VRCAYRGRSGEAASCWLVSHWSLGIATEELQPFTGGTAVPARVVILWVGLLLLLLVATLVATVRVLLAYQQRDAAFPELLTPAVWRVSLLMASSSGVRVVTAPVAWTAFTGTAVLEVTFARSDYPGIQLSEVVPDWSAFDDLVVEAFLPEGPAITLTAAVGYLGTPGTSAHLRQTLQPGAQRLHYPMRVLLDAQDGPALRISHLVLHTGAEIAGRSLLIARVALEPVAAAGMR
jgi:hypothetical protein